MAFTRRTSTTSPTDMSTSAYYNNKTYCGSHSYNDYYGINYQCTYYALARSCEIAGGKITYFTAYGESASDCIDSNPIFSRQGFGNGGEWFSDARWETTTDPNSVSAGDIVCYGSSSGGGLGHVAVIEAVTSTSFILSEANWTYANKCDFDREITKTTGGGASAGGIQGYIINPYKGHAPSTKATLSYSVSPSGYGYITGTAQGTYDIGTSITVTAHANSGHTFTGWSDGTTTATNSFALATDTTLVAYFDEEPPATTYHLSYSVSPDGSGYITGDEQGDYEEGETITIEAHANTGWIFDYWQGRSVSYDNPKTETMNRDRSYIAYFKRDPAFLSVLAKITNDEEGNLHEITILV